MKIMHDLLPRQKPRKHRLQVSVDLYPYAEELYEEFEKLGIIDRIKDIPQLGVIKVTKSLSKTRFDYVLLQLYLHQLIRKNLNDKLRYSYNNKIKSEEFRNNYSYSANAVEPTMYDVLQMLTLIYNVGHFYNTFTASQAITILAREDDNFCDFVVHTFKDNRNQDAAKSILINNNYQRMHILNSILVLERCDQSKQAVSVALEILYAYLHEQSLSENSKLKYAFTIFRHVRDVSFIAYDLQIAQIPLTIDLYDEVAMKLFFTELLSEYNDNRHLIDFLNSVSKLLDDTVYNESSNAICYYQISKKMVRQLQKCSSVTGYRDYYHLFINRKSILNSKYPRVKDYVQSHILKLTFRAEYREIAENLMSKLEKTNNTRVGYYNRGSSGQTILVSIKRNCDIDTKRNAAFKVLKYCVSSLRNISGISTYDENFLLTVKFFLFYLFDERPVEIRPSIHEKICVICTRGKKRRIEKISSILNSSNANDDQKHEVEFLRSLLVNDTNNDTTITITASIQVKDKNEPDKKFCELDGMIIYPMRKSDQVIFLEAKNTRKRPAYGKNCLADKLDKLEIPFAKKDIMICDYDAYWKYSISKK